MSMRSAVVVCPKYAGRPAYRRQSVATIILRANHYPEIGDGGGNTEAKPRRF